MFNFLSEIECKHSSSPLPKKSELVGNFVSSPFTECFYEKAFSLSKQSYNNGKEKGGGGKLNHTKRQFIRQANLWQSYNNGTEYC